MQSREKKGNIKIGTNSKQYTHSTGTPFYPASILRFRTEGEEVGGAIASSFALVLIQA